MIRKGNISFGRRPIFEGCSFGAEGEAAGEVVFNTSMTGYQEILTDPSYEGQIVAMTYPQSATSASTRRTWNRTGLLSKVHRKRIYGGAE